ncbi:MAG: YeeE/YedE family protein [candidate division KSB1 bacterium]|nr:YeeE/YedE family protein [candidate division KSB1 bacterium]MDZ7273654.1 YeeE/YedE family protein [candidate division KSB1 bacterium]MDZ7285810.1 YeeE/YedE family protein [candidate division KSB1 bacterium]MDZ7298842.1 YeeE/YedE family protein [candidate division KSB1 bacterium]MDZ7350013.1 YeeE/YedE family protein [candidate division KSB1 bacterium]
MPEPQEKYWSPYLAGVVLGLVLLATFVIMGRGLGASGALMRVTTYAVDQVSPGLVDNNPYLAQYAGGNKNPLQDWLVFEVIGVIVGGLLSGLLAGRIRFLTDRGPRFSAAGRLVFAFLGGGLMGFGARLAQGCTSGQALTGGATLAFGSWAFMMTMFAAAYALAYFVRRQWI